MRFSPGCWACTCGWWWPRSSRPPTSPGSCCRTWKQISNIKKCFRIKNLIPRSAELQCSYCVWARICYKIGWLVVAMVKTAVKLRLAVSKWTKKNVWFPSFHDNCCKADVHYSNQCCGSMTFWGGSGSGSGSADPCLWLMDPDLDVDSDPALFVIDLPKMPIKI